MILARSRFSSNATKLCFSVPVILFGHVVLTTHLLFFFLFFLSPLRNSPLRTEAFRTRSLIKHRARRLFLVKGRQQTCSPLSCPAGQKDMQEDCRSGRQLSSGGSQLRFLLPLIIPGDYNKRDPERENWPCRVMLPILPIQSISGSRLL